MYALRTVFKGNHIAFLMPVSILGDPGAVSQVAGIFVGPATRLTAPGSPRMAGLPKTAAWEAIDLSVSWS